ncbi:MAG: histidinol-phosphate transaminase [Nakamurella sp.]
MVVLRDALAKLPAYTPGRTVPGAVKLASNEMPYPPLPSVAEAIASLVSAEQTTGFNRYPDNAAVALSEALAAHVGAEVANIAVGCGSVALCQQLIQVTCDDGDEVLFPWRSFEAYPIVTTVVGAVPVTVPVGADHRLDLGALAAAITERTRLVFVCTPNNPTSTVVTDAELTAFLDAVPERVLVVVDEAYVEFVRDPSAAKGVAAALSRPNVVSIRTLSKAYGLAGLRVGYAVGSAGIIAAIRKVGLPFAVNDLAQVAAVAALSDAALPELEKRLAIVLSERSRVLSALREAGYGVPESQSNFVWLPLRERAAEFASHCEAGGVIVRPFADATGGVRVTIGLPAGNDAFLAAARSFNL